MPAKVPGVWVDYSSVPHVVDLILSFMAREELITCRATSQILRKVADRHLARYLELDLLQGLVLADNPLCRLPSAYQRGPFLLRCQSNPRIPDVSIYAPPGDHAWFRQVAESAVQLRVINAPATAEPVEGLHLFAPVEPPEVKKLVIETEAAALSCSIPIRSKTLVHAMVLLPYGGGNSCWRRLPGQTWFEGVVDIPEGTENYLVDILMSSPASSFPWRHGYDLWVSAFSSN